MNKKLILVSGASSGFGYQITCDLLKQGHKVIGVSRNESDEIVKLKQDYSDRFNFQKKDLSIEIDALPKWVVALSKEYGKFYGFVHSAGMLQTLPLQVNSYKKMIDIFNINLFAGLAISKGIADRRANDGMGTSIVFISSFASITGSAGIINYSASKAALNGAMRAMAVELAPLKIRVNSVLPGFINTALIDQWKDVYTNEYIQNINDSCPLGEGYVDDVSNMVLFLLSDQSKWITGSEFRVDGGRSIGGL